MTTTYHPDPAINAEVIADVLDGERADLAAGLLPRRWLCPCGQAHSRGHFGSAGIHRCLSCGYTGPDGVLLDESAEPPYCPFSGDGVCYGGCPSMTDRACINGSDDD